MSPNLKPGLSQYKIFFTQFLGQCKPQNVLNDVLDEESWFSFKVIWPKNCTSIVTNWDVNRTWVLQSVFPFNSYYDGNKFVMLNGFTLTKTICQKIWEKPHPRMQAKSLLKPFKVEAHRSKNDFAWARQVYVNILMTVHCGPLLGFSPATDLNIAHAVNGEIKCCKMNLSQSYVLRKFLKYS